MMKQKLGSVITPIEEVAVDQVEICARYRMKAIAVCDNSLRSRPEIIDDGSVVGNMI